MRQIINEKTVMAFFIKEAEQDKIAFLKNREVQKAEICSVIRELMKEDTMNRKIRIACDLWKKLFSSAMSYISSNRQGYDKIFRFFDSYVEFEELIFASDSFYRDHTLHCIWVYFLGEYIKRSEEFETLFEDQKKQLNMLNKAVEVFDVIGISNRENYQKFIDLIDIMKKNAETDEAARCVAALTHDLGYPLKKIDKINHSIQKVLPYFGVHDSSNFSFEYTNGQTAFINQFLDFLSREFRVYIDIETIEAGEIFLKIFETDEQSNLIKVNEEAVRSLTEQKQKLIADHCIAKSSFKEVVSRKLGFSNDFEVYQHGIMSAFLLCKNLQAFQCIDYDGIQGTSEADQTAKVLALQNILKSVALHTSDVLKISEINTVNFLTFVDELEEFSRISRASQNREYVKEFCDTSLYMEDGWLNIVFEFNNTNLDNLNPEISFKGRCKRFLSLFDIPQLSSNLKLRVKCVGKLPNDQNTYTLQIAKRYAEIMINGKAVDIPSYLRSEQYCTTEEYAVMQA